MKGVMINPLLFIRRMVWIFFYFFLKTFLFLEKLFLFFFEKDFWKRILRVFLAGINGEKGRYYHRIRPVLWKVDVINPLLFIRRMVWIFFYFFFKLFYFWKTFFYFMKFFFEKLFFIFFLKTFLFLEKLFLFWNFFFKIIFCFIKILKHFYILSMD